MRERLKIGEVARLLGVTAKTVRHYEKVGLLGEPQRLASKLRERSAKDHSRSRRRWPDYERDRS